MMALPFMTLFEALIAAYFSYRAWSIFLWMITLILLLALFRWHATDPLSLQF